MQAIETAWKQFFGQFAPFVFSDGDYFQDPNDVMFPRLTYSAGITETLNNGLVTVILWDKSFNDSRIWEMHKKIDEAIPALSGSTLLIPSESYFEYQDPISGLWQRFEQSEFQDIADRFAPVPVEWRKISGGQKQEITIWRDTTYSQPYRQDEILIRARLIRLHVRNRTSI